MKKIIWFFVFLYVCIPSLKLAAHLKLSDAESPKFSSAFTAGYVFKNDCRFKDVYGLGMVNVITGDFVYYPWDFWGLGLKTSYWRAKGRTTLLNLCTKLEEIPLTFTVKRLVIFKHDIEFYGSLGGGVVWMREKSELECVKMLKGIGEVEIGLNYPICNHFKFTTAFRYLFPRQYVGCSKIDVGGADLRAGFELVF
ncbi:MAG: hypothetical protein NTZ68_04185 [Candidatus Dependentiae bacterium]|nr:hypothetical protein [Candidatus Dependentiae bacterium]